MNEISLELFLRLALDRGMALEGIDLSLVPDDLVLAHKQYIIAQRNFHNLCHKYYRELYEQQC